MDLTELAGVNKVTLHVTRVAVLFITECIW